MQRDWQSVAVAVAVDDSRRQKVPSSRRSAAEGQFADIGASEHHQRSNSRPWMSKGLLFTENVASASAVS